MKHISTIAAALLAFSMSAAAKGPTGLGALKLGMTKQEIEALPASEDVHLNGPMTPYEDKNTTPKPEEDKFDASLTTPLATAPMKAVLTFEGGRLTGLYLTLDQSSKMLERITNQITERYGPGKVEDNRKEEQCIYKNGANFKLTSGVVSTKWVEQISPAERIESSVSDISIEICPPSLRNRIGPIMLRSLSIERANASKEPKPKNLF